MFLFISGLHRTGDRAFEMVGAADRAARGLGLGLGLDEGRQR
ncbi:hypothetical protein ENSA5_41420 [Enhygromyxa salina]|uniref:Uncharacterized protein n=1 Tax=Enhygromyxa salina TaxID=215803 RepID=A0A2S9XMT0_9BACT|nr:hypothetical protein [Enhygromyxa salina]PRP94030.1 hypothetical protein ENSA5_41420 [Enhygromyxa salina]